MKNKKIVLCEVIEIKDDYIVAKYKNKNIKCPIKWISDYPVNLHTFFQVGNKYKFLLKYETHLSYKEIRPKLLKNKIGPTPTASGVRTLERMLLNELKKISIN